MSVMNESEKMPADIAMNQIFTMIQFANPDWYEKTLKPSIIKYGDKIALESLTVSSNFNNFTREQLEEAQKIIWDSKLSDEISGRILSSYLLGRIDQLKDIQSRIK